MQTRRLSRGFTLIEVLITLIIMVILLGLGIAATGNLQAQARDKEREQDVETIARGLELRYKKGSTYTNNSGVVITNNPGSYPGSNEMWDIMWYHSAPLSEVLPGVSEEAQTTPTGGGFDAICMLYGYNADCDRVEKQSVVQTSFSDDSGGWKDKYVYEFVGRDNKYCTTACVRYNIYWISETDKTPYLGIPGLKVYRSKHQ